MAIIKTPDLSKNHYTIGESASEESTKYIAWYESRPYGFKFNPPDGDKPTIMYLPISPSNINISTQFATNIVNTLYGVVEQHSEVKYYDITIQGTTGFVPQYSSPGTSVSQQADSGRDQFSNDAQGNLSLGGFLPEVTNMVNQAVSVANDITGANDKTTTGVYKDKNGYVAFHNFYRFLLEYKKRIAEESEGGSVGSVGASVATGLTSPPGVGNLRAFESTVARPGVGNLRAFESTVTAGSAPLQFLNYKDNNQYDVVVNSFELRRSAESPMLYKYSISIRGYNLSTVGDDSNRVSLNAISAATGTDGIDFSSVSSVVGSASTLISGIL
jgi:hypothetical protein